MRKPGFLGLNPLAFRCRIEVVRCLSRAQKPDRLLIFDKLKYVVPTTSWLGKTLNALKNIESVII